MIAHFRYVQLSSSVSTLEYTRDYHGRHDKSYVNPDFEAYYFYSTLQLVLFALRIYAICGRNKIIVFIALAMILARLAGDIWVR